MPSAMLATGVPATGVPATALPLLHCSIELLYYRTSVPSNERLVREADVNATVAERRPHYLELVADHGRLVNPVFVPREPIWVARVPAGSGQAGVRAVDSGRLPAGRPPSAAGRRDGAARGREAARPAAGRRGTAGQEPAGQVRLTRRGRLVITSAVVVLIAAGSMGASVAVAGAAGAMAHPGGPVHSASPAQPVIQAAAGAPRG